MQRVANQFVLSCSLFLLAAACALGGDAAARPVFGADLTARLAAYKADHARLVPQGEGQPFASALCVPVDKQMPHAWDVQMIVQSTDAVAAGDTLSVAFAIWRTMPRAD